MNFGKLSAIKIREIIVGGENSPTELVSDILKKTDAANERLNCFITIRGEFALDSARGLVKKLQNKQAPGRLAGIPIAVKDNISTKDILTTCGSRMLEKYVPPYNATAISDLLAEDAILIGKTNMDEFGMGSSNENSYFGPVLNPINTDYVPGGSSGGSACAVAAGLVPLALGSDTGGSVRQPASFCGIVGLKPTYGAISRYGLVAFGSSLDQIGLFARSVEDCAMLFSVLSRHDSRDSTSSGIARPDYTVNINRFEKIKIGLPSEYFAEGIDSEVSNAVRRAIDKLKHMGCEIIDISLPHTDFAIAAYYVIANAEASSNLARYDGVRYGYRSKNSKELGMMYRSTRAEGFGAEVKRRIMLGTYALSAGYYDKYYLKASAVREIIRRDFQKAFQMVDLIITPTSPTAAFKLGEKIDDPLSMYLSDIYTVSANLAYFPAMSIPCGKTAEGMPIGLQIMADMFAEERILRLANALEQELGFEL